MRLIRDSFVPDGCWLPRNSSGGGEYVTDSLGNCEPTWTVYSRMSPDTPLWFTAMPRIGAVRGSTVGRLLQVLAVALHVALVSDLQARLLYRGVYTEMEQDT